MRARRLVGIVFAFGVVAACTQENGIYPREPDYQGPASVSTNWGSEPPVGDGGTAPIDTGKKSFLNFGTTVSAAKPPPPLSGGTLAISKDGALAIAADPDRDVVHIVDLATRAVVDVGFNENDEPGRVVEDDGRRAHVVLRRGGAIATIDLAAKKLLERRAVCPAPRGIAHEPMADAIYVACAGGELVTLPARTGPIVRTVHIERDLRDVVVKGEKLFVSTFRGAQLLEIGADGTVKTRRGPAVSALVVDKGAKMIPHVAWRTIADPAGGVLMLHQRSRVEPISPAPGGYGGGSGCGNVVQGTTTAFDTGATAPVPRTGLPAAVLPIDVAISGDGSKVAIVHAGNAKLSGVPTVVVYSPAQLAGPIEGCTEGLQFVPGGEVIAVAWANGVSPQLVYQTREPATLVVGSDAPIPLSSVSRADTGHAIFHANTGASLACASCHPEGGDDAHTWSFDSIGPRRTQTFRGGVLGTEPLHWDGDMKDIGSLMANVFAQRMSGIPLDAPQLAALTKWVDAIPTIPNSAPSDTAAVSRGAALYADTTVGCSGCHSGANLTNNFSVNVGTGKAFQVPSLRGIGWRAPYMHDGCAPTLLDRFGSCGGGDQHGKTSHLTDAQKKDLVAYLETL